MNLPREVAVEAARRMAVLRRLYGELADYLLHAVYGELADDGQEDDRWRVLWSQVEDEQAALAKLITAAGAP